MKSPSTEMRGVDVSLSLLPVRVSLFCQYIATWPIRFFNIYEFLLTGLFVSECVCVWTKRK